MRGNIHTWIHITRKAFEGALFYNNILVLPYSAAQFRNSLRYADDIFRSTLGILIQNENFEAI